MRLTAIVKGRRAVSADTALLLEGLTRWDAEIWLRLQAKWDLWHTARARGPRVKVRALPRSAQTGRAATSRRNYAAAITIQLRSSSQADYSGVGGNPPFPAPP